MHPVSRLLPQRVRLGARLLLDRGAAGRFLTVRPDDVFIVSYPKSGNTWLRFLIGNLLSTEKPVTFLNVERIVPDIYQNNHAELSALPSPRFLKSHEPFIPSYGTVVYVVRDPRDVAVSYYHHHIKCGTIDEGYPMDDYVRQFVSGGLDTYGSWRENVGSWLGARAGSPAFLALRYEDLLEETQAQLQTVATFLGLEVTRDGLERATTLSAAGAMRNLERQQAAAWKPTRQGRLDKPFVRAAAAGGWTKELSPQSVSMIESAWAEQMTKLGYDLHVAR